MPSATADSNTEIRLQEYLSVCPNIYFSSKSPIKNKSFIPGPFSANRKLAFSENRPGFHKTGWEYYQLGIHLLWIYGFVDPHNSYFLHWR